MKKTKQEMYLELFEQRNKLLQLVSDQTRLIHKQSKLIRKHRELISLIEERDKKRWWQIWR